MAAILDSWYANINLLLVISHLTWKDWPDGSPINGDLVKFKMAAILDICYHLSSTFVWLVATYLEKMGLIGPMVL